MADGSVTDVQVAQSSGVVAARPRRPTRRADRGAVRPATQGLWNQTDHDPGQFQADAVGGRSRSSRRRASALRRRAGAARPPPRSRRPGDVAPSSSTAAAERFAVPDCIPRTGDEAEPRGLPDAHPGPAQRPRVREDCRFVPDSLIAAIPPLNPDAPNFIDWQGIGADHAGDDDARGSTGGELTVEAKLTPSDTGKAMLAKRYTGKADNPRIFAHQASDEIMALAQIQGRGAQQDRVRLRPRLRAAGRTKELYIMDYDGFNPRRVTVNNSINILPAWSPDGRSLAYVSYRQGTPDIYVASIFEGKSSNVTGRRAASPSPPPSARTASASRTPATGRATATSGWRTPTAAARAG